MRVEKDSSEIRQQIALPQIQTKEKGKTEKSSKEVMGNFLSENRALHSTSAGISEFCFNKAWYAQTYTAKGISLLAAIFFAYIYGKSAPKPHTENKSSNQQPKKEV